MNWLKKRGWVIIGALLIAVLLVGLGVQVVDRPAPTSEGLTTIGTGEKVITIGGEEAVAAGSVDYTFGAANANVQFQTALNALPATGGRLVVVSSVQVNWAALTTVTRAIPNVVIEGSGAGTSFVGDGVTPVFTAGGNGWTFVNVKTDAGGINMGATTGWMWTNVTIGAAYYAYRSPYGQSAFAATTVSSLTDSGLTSGRIPIVGSGGLLGDSSNLTFNTATGTLLTSAISAPVGRGATYVIAAADSPPQDKNQADFVCSGVGDDTQIQTWLNTGYDVWLMWGHYDIKMSALTLAIDNQSLSSTEGAVLKANSALVADVVLVTADNVTVSGLTVDANKATRALLSGDGIHLQGASRSRVFNNRVYNIPTWGIALTDTSTYNQVKGNIIESAEHNDLILRGQTTTFNVIEGNTLIASGSDGIDLFEGASYNTITNNNIHAPAANGIIVHPTVAGAVGERAYDNSITGNVITNAGNVGINLQNAYHQVVSANTINQTATVAIYLLDGSLYSSITGNNIDTAVGGIYVSGVSNYATVTGNNIFNCSTLDVAVGSSWGNYTSNTLVGSGQGFNIAGNFDQNVISSNIIKDMAAEGIYWQGGGTSDDNLFVNNQIYGGTRSIRFASPGVRNVVEGNVVRGASVYGLVVDSNTDQAFIINNDLRQNTNAATVAGTNLTIRGNLGYIARGEIVTYSGTIATLTQDAYNSLDNPFGQAVRVKSLDIYVSTNATAALPNIDCGIGSSATTDYTTLFNDLPGETIGFYTSTIATPGTQTVPQLWASGSGNRYMNMSIKDAAATGMVATYTVTVMGN